MKMKRYTFIILAVVMILSTLALASCGDNGNNTDNTTTAANTASTAAGTKTSATKTESNAPETSGTGAPVKVMSHAEYDAAEFDSHVVVETFIQAKQSWWDGKATFYTQDDDGGYFIYNMPCTEAEYEELVKGTLIRVSGTKSEWSGEIEIVDATYEIIEGVTFEANSVDVTELLGTDDLIKHQNEFVKFSSMKVEKSTDGDGNEAAFLYKWNGSGTEGDDLYFNVSYNGTTYTFTVESYLCGAETEVYKAVKELKVGDIVDMEGFLYWYEGVNPHITSVKVTASPKADVMTYAEYDAAEIDDPVVVETYVQAKQSWWDNKATLYTQDENGAYFIYEMPCTKEEYEKLTTGTKIRVSGRKSQWSGEIEIIDATFEILEGSYIPAAFDVTELLGTEDLIKHQNKFVSFKGMKVEESTDEDGNKAAFLYKWNGAGTEGDDLYFKVSYNGNTYTFTVESYLCGAETDVYKAVKELKVGDVIDMEGFLYWYEGVNPHITSVKAAA